MNLLRSSSAVRIELSLPSSVSAVLFLLTPLLGVISWQMIAKSFVLVLQFLTLQLFSNRISPHLASVAGTPSLSEFHCTPQAGTDVCSALPRVRHRSQCPQHCHQCCDMDARQDETNTAAMGMDDTVGWCYVWHQ